MLIASFLRTLTRYPKLARAGAPLGNVEQMQSKSQINRAFQTELHIPGNSTLCAGDTGQPVSLLFPLGIQASRRPAW